MRISRTQHSRLSVGTILSAALFALVLLSGVACAKDQEVTSTVTLSKDYSITLASTPFDLTEHEISYCHGDIPCLINGIPIFGIDGSLPSSQVKKVTLHGPTGVIILEHKGMFNAWSPFDDDRAHLWLKKLSDDELQIRGEFSDGSAAYVVEWLVVKTESIRVAINCATCETLEEASNN